MKKAFQANSISQFLQKKHLIAESIKQQIAENSHFICSFFEDTKAQHPYYLYEYLLPCAAEERYLNALQFIDECNSLQVDSNSYIQESFQQTTLHFLAVLPNKTMWKSSFMKRNMHASAMLIKIIQDAMVSSKFEENFICDALESSSVFVIEYALWLAFLKISVPQSIEQKISNLQGERFNNIKQKIHVIHEVDLLKIEDLYSSSETEDYLLSLYHLFNDERTANWPLILDEDILGDSSYKSYFLHLLANVFPSSINDNVRVPELLKCSDLDVKKLGIHKALDNIKPCYLEATLQNLTDIFPANPGEIFYQNLLYLLFKIGDKQEFTIKILIDLLENKEFSSKTKCWLMSMIAERGAEYEISFVALQKQCLVDSENSLYALNTLGHLTTEHPKKFTYLLNIFSLVQNQNLLISWISQISSLDINFFMQILMLNNKELFCFVSQQIIALQNIPEILEQLFLQKLNDFIQECNEQQSIVILKAISYHKMLMSDKNIDNLLRLLCMYKTRHYWILYTLIITNSTIPLQELHYLCYEEQLEHKIHYLLNVKFSILENDFLKRRSQLPPTEQSILEKNLQHNREYYLKQINNVDKRLYTTENLITYFQMLNAPLELINLIPKLTFTEQAKAIKVLSDLFPLDEAWKIESILLDHISYLREAHKILSIIATTQKDSVTTIIQQQICHLLNEKNDIPQDISNWLLEQNFNTEQTNKNTVAISQKIPFEQPPFLSPLLFQRPKFIPEALNQQFQIFASAPYPFLPENKWIHLHEKLKIFPQEPLLFQVHKICGTSRTEQFFQASGIEIRFRRYHTHSYDLQQLPGNENRLEFIVIDLRGEQTNIDLKNWLENHIDEQIARLGNFFFVIQFHNIDDFSYDFTAKLAPEYCLMITDNKKLRHKYSRFTFFDNKEEAFIYGKNSKLSIHDKRSAFDSLKPKPEATIDWMGMEQERGISLPRQLQSKIEDLDHKSAPLKKKSKLKSAPSAKKPSLPSKSVYGKPARPRSSSAPAPSAPTPPPPPASPPIAGRKSDRFGGGGIAIGGLGSSTSQASVPPKPPQLQKPKPTLEKKKGKISKEISKEIAIEQEPKIEETTKKSKRARGKKKQEQFYEELRRIDISPPRWFEKWLSDSAGHPGPVERLVAQSTFAMKSVQYTIGLRFIMLAHFGDVIIEAVTSYVRGVFETWKNYKTMQKRLQMKGPEQQISVIEKDINRAREQFSRAFYLAGYSTYDRANIQSTFALKLVIELRGHLDQMKRDLSFVNAEEIQKNVQSSIVDFFKSFIPNPIEIILPIKDSILIAFCMKYSRSEIEKMYVDMFISYQVLLSCLIEKNNLLETPTFKLKEYEQQLVQSIGQGYIPENKKDIKLCINECREKIQKLIQMSCNCHYLITVKKWSKKDLLIEYKKYQQQDIINPIIFLEMEIWTRKLAHKYIKYKNIDISIQDKKQQIEEQKHFRRRYKIAKTLHKQFLQ